MERGQELQPAENVFNTLIQDLTKDKQPAELRQIHGDIQKFLALLQKTTVNDVGEAQNNYRWPDFKENRNANVSTLLNTLQKVRTTTSQDIPDQQLSAFIYDLLLEKSKNIMESVTGKPVDPIPQAATHSPYAPALSDGTTSQPSERAEPLDSQESVHTAKWVEGQGAIFARATISSIAPHKNASTETMEDDEALRGSSTRPAAPPSQFKLKPSSLASSQHQGSSLDEERRSHRKLTVLERFVAQKLDITKTTIDESLTLQELLHSYVYDKKYTAWRSHRDLVKKVLESLEGSEATDQDYMTVLTNKLADLGKPIEQQGTLALIIDYANHKIALQNPQKSSALLEQQSAIKKRWEQTLEKLNIQGQIPDSSAQQARLLLHSYVYPKMFSSNRHYKLDVSNLLNNHPDATASDYYHGLYAILEAHPKANPQGTLAVVLRTLKDLSALEAQNKNMVSYLAENNDDQELSGFATLRNE